MVETLAPNNFEIAPINRCLPFRILFDLFNYFSENHLMKSKIMILQAKRHSHRNFCQRNSVWFHHMMWFHKSNVWSSKLTFNISQFFTYFEFSTYDISHFNFCSNPIVWCNQTSTYFEVTDPQLKFQSVIRQYWTRWMCNKKPIDRWRWLHLQITRSLAWNRQNYLYEQYLNLFEARKNIFFIFCK